MQKCFSESNKSLLLTLQNDAITPPYSVSHYSTVNKPRGHMWVTRLEWIKPNYRQKCRQMITHSNTQALSLPAHQLARWDIHQNRQTKIQIHMGSEAHCADGRRRSVRQMRFCLLTAEGCENESLDYFSSKVFDGLSELELSLSSIWSWHTIKRKKQSIQTSTSHKRAAHIQTKAMKSTAYHITSCFLLQSFSREAQYDSNVNSMSSASFLLSWLVGAVLQALLLSYCLVSSSSCFNSIQSRARNGKALHRYVPFCWFRLTKIEIKWYGERRRGHS